MEAQSIDILNYLTVIRLLSQGMNMFPFSQNSFLLCLALDQSTSKVMALWSKIKL